MTYETFEVGKFSVRIATDPEPSDPREDDNLGTMICWHTKYILGDRKRGERMPFDTPRDFQEWVDSEDSDVALCLPLYLYDHSGITMSCSPFSCPWDSGQVGYIYITREKIRSEYSVKRITKKLLDRVREYLVGEVKTYDQFLTGDVYGFVIEDEDGNTVDSCWGFFGEEYAKQEARASAEWHVKAAQTKLAQELLREFETNQFVDRCFAL